MGSVMGTTEGATTRAGAATAAGQSTIAPGPRPPPWAQCSVTASRWSSTGCQSTRTRPSLTAPAIRSLVESPSREGAPMYAAGVTLTPVAQTPVETSGETHVATCAATPTGGRKVVPTHTSPTCGPTITVVGVVVTTMAVARIPRQIITVGTPTVVGARDVRTPTVARTTGTEGIRTPGWTRERSPYQGWTVGIVVTPATSHAHRTTTDVVETMATADLTIAGITTQMDTVTGRSVGQGGSCGARNMLADWTPATSPLHSAEAAQGWMW